TVKIKGICSAYSEGKALLETDGGRFAIQVMTYRYQPDTEYTVIGKFAGIMDAKGDDLDWAIIVEETHLPFMSEYGL
ncbi:hypothetical protein, partial [Sporomusa sp.]|uniref:hypothetical protein n=1 Tax=Sporomusa sp. TaxID=2078658 RepID=UPI002C57DA36